MVGYESYLIIFSVEENGNKYLVFMPTFNLYDYHTHPLYKTNSKVVEWYDVHYLGYDAYTLEQKLIKALISSGYLSKFKEPICVNGTLVNNYKLSYTNLREAVGFIREEVSKIVGINLEEPPQWAEED